MTVLQPASWHDVLFMEDFLECANAAFDTIPTGVSIAAVDVMFRRWIGFAVAGRTDPDWPADVLFLFCWLARTLGRFDSIGGSSES